MNRLQKLEGKLELSTTSDTDKGHLSVSIYQIIMQSIHYFSRLGSLGSVFMYFLHASDTTDDVYE